MTKEAQTGGMGAPHPACGGLKLYSHRISEIIHTYLLLFIHEPHEEFETWHCSRRSALQVHSIALGGRREGGGGRREGGREGDERWERKRGGRGVGEGGREMRGRERCRRGGEGGRERDERWERDGER